MKRFATIALVSLLSSIAFTAAAQAQIQYDFTTNGRAGFYAIGLNVDDVYAVSATVNGSPLSIYAQPSGPPLDPAKSLLMMQETVQERYISSSYLPHREAPLT